MTDNSSYIPEEAYDEVFVQLLTGDGIVATVNQYGSWYNHSLVKLDERSLTAVRPHYQDATHAILTNTRADGGIQVFPCFDEAVQEWKAILETMADHLPEEDPRD